MRVLYICTGNAFRSPVAEALTRKHHPDFEAESAGMSPASEVAENGKDLLENIEADQYLKPNPDCITQRAIDQADLVVAMEENHREYLEENFRTDGKNIIVWKVKDPINPEIEPKEAFQEIEEKVQNLLP